MVGRGKKGAAAVFITLILSSMILSIIVIEREAMERLKESMCDAAITLSSRSILSEYDIRLKEEYGIFAYKNLGDELNYKLKRYIGANLSGSFKPFNADKITIEIENSKYSLAEIDIFEKEILTSGMIDSVIAKQGAKRKKVAPASKKIVNEALIKGLPSQGRAMKALNVDFFNGDRSMLDKASDIYLINRYIFSTFKCRTSDISNRESFFENEIEYIISGKLSENDSLKYIEKELLAIRFALNAIHIKNDSQKMAEIMAYVAALPITADPIEAAALIIIWASVEAENDVDLLMAGENVAFVKTREQWAVPFRRALDRILNEGYIRPKDSKGQSYEDYLNGILYIEDQDTKLLRMMDLIQINMRTYYNGDFLIKEHYVGFDICATIDGKDYRYAQYY